LLCCIGERLGVRLPAHKVFCIAAERLVRREVQIFRPFDDLAVRVYRFLGTERGPSNEAFKHDGSKRPPVAAVIIAFAGKYLWGNVVGCSDR